tara:strand:- start:265 stop:822 length:558 start_codon:yes stop_codon:yes gene_type:complete
MKNPTNSNSNDDKNTAGYLLIASKDNNRPCIYIEKCEKMKDVFDDIRFNNQHKLHFWLVEYSKFPPQDFKDSEGKIDYRAWFSKNYTAKKAETIQKEVYAVFRNESIPHDVKLSRFWDELKKNKITNLNCLLNNCTLYELKRKIKKTQKVKCPDCGKLHSRVNLARHQKYNCKHSSKKPVVNGLI